ncbi:hypothetical protein TELCIR_23469, partial [Teladorsagia circumcincta]
EQLKADQKKTAIMKPPTLLETAAFGLFYTGTIAGPQFTLSKFRSYVNGDWLDENEHVIPNAMDVDDDMVQADDVSLLCYLAYNC